ncbi:MAG: phosphate signaling complex protein PhoU [Rhizobiaceae bacterium]|nr:phosphate signaling complex protein PhoU [Rhizobiaceae bacterium]
MNQSHIVTSFDEDLKTVSGKLLEMAGYAEDLVHKAVRSLMTADMELARLVIDEDKLIDRKQSELDEMAVLLIARRQPMANDLREVVGALRMANDIERIGDMGKSIARRVIEIGDLGDLRTRIRGLEQLTSLALEQLKEVLDAYAARDLTRAKLVWERDEEIDALYTSLFRELLTYMMEDPSNITPCTHLLFCAKNIERVGDHATNIAEIVEFIQTGKIEFEKESHAL